MIQLNKNSKLWKYSYRNSEGIYIPITGFINAAILSGDFPDELKLVYVTNSGFS